MRWDDVYIRSVAASLGRTVFTADAVADGRYDAGEREASGYLGVRVADEGPAVELAVRAAQAAVERSGLTGDDFSLVVHVNIAHQGLDDFASASYLQSRTVRGRATALEIRQASNGGLAALVMGASFLTANPEPGSVLLATSDRFVPPQYDRFRTAAGLLLGDGGTAMVLSRGSGVARLVSSILIGDATYQDMQIGTDTWTEYPGGNGWPVDTQRRVDAFVGQHGPDIFPELVESISGFENQTIEQALADADLKPQDIAWWVFPNMGALTDWYALEELGADESRTTWG